MEAIVILSKEVIVGLLLTEDVGLSNMPNKDLATLYHHWMTAPYVGSFEMYLKSLYGVECTFITSDSITRVQLERN